MSDQAKGVLPQQGAVPAPSADIRAQFRPTDSPDPNVYARIILRRAGIVPLLSMLAACLVMMAPHRAEAQAGEGIRAAALARARASVINDAVRSGPTAAPTSAQQQDVTSRQRVERILPCPPAAAQPARAPVQPCVARRLIIRDMP